MIDHSWKVRKKRSDEIVLSRILLESKFTTGSALSLRNNTFRCVIASSSNPPLLCLYVTLCVHVPRVEQARKRDRCASVISN